jgi:hypothetical protein
VMSTTSTKENLRMRMTISQKKYSDLRRAKKGGDRGSALGSHDDTTKPPRFSSVP